MQKYFYILFLDIYQLRILFFIACKFSLMIDCFAFYPSSIQGFTELYYLKLLNNSWNVHIYLFIVL